MTKLTRKELHKTKEKNDRIYNDFVMDLNLKKGDKIVYLQEIENTDIKYRKINDVVLDIQDNLEAGCATHFRAKTTEDGHFYPVIDITSVNGRLVEYNHNLPPREVI